MPNRHAQQAFLAVPARNYAVLARIAIDIELLIRNCFSRLIVLGAARVKSPLLIVEI